MSEVREVLDEVLSCVRHVRLVEAQELLSNLLRTMGPAELRVWEPDLREVIEEFLPKRRKELAQLLDEVLARPPAFHKPKVREAPRAHDDPRMAALTLNLQPTLAELSQRHIFQWSTFYRDEIGDFFTRALALADESQELEFRAVRELFAEHAADIFQKGYAHVTRSGTHEYAMHKSVSGLRRFLDLIVEFYTGAVGPGLSRVQAGGLRNLASAALCGIVAGYSRLDLGQSSCKQVLIERPEVWMHTTGFLRAADADILFGALGADDYTGLSLNAAVKPLLGALDVAVGRSDNYVPLPVLCEYSPILMAIDISLQPDPYAPQRGLLELRCFLDSGSASRVAIRDALSRGTSVVVAPLRPDVRQVVTQDSSTFAHVVVTMQDAPNGNDTRDRVVEILETVLYKEKTPRSGLGPLTYNFAREFPLNDPVMSPYYFVVRNSVRDLLRTFERRNGVRLWCSVRRSGKTKACTDLASTTEESILIAQTCDSTGDAMGDSLLYSRIAAAFQSGEQLPDDFLRGVLQECSDGPSVNDSRVVLLLDEYETLFGRIRTAVSHDERLRYTVAQPLLNQLVQFARDNLLVLLGQQPNAHLVLMDQNQLSPYVQQDPFPLFQNTDVAPEFSELISKVFAGRASFDRSFVDRVHVETWGHPYLTVSLLVDFVEWLIRTKRPLSSLNFTAADISQFAARGLRRDQISMSNQYQFFRDGAIPQALGAQGKARSPWLHCMYRLIQEISRASPDTFTCSRSEFSELVTSLGLDQMGFSAESLLMTGSQSNFLTYTDRIVAPRVRLLGRIAAVATAEVS